MRKLSLTIALLAACGGGDDDGEAPDARLFDAPPIDATDTVDAEPVDAAPPPPDAGMVTIAAEQRAYLKSTSPDASDHFGNAVALSADGTTLAIGVWDEDSNAAGIGGDPTSDTLPNSGAVFVFRRTGDVWAIEAYLKASNPGANDYFGNKVTLSDSGDTLAVSAHAEDSAATGVDGNQSSEAAENAGAVYVFQRTGTVWAQQAYLKASNTGAGDSFGNGDIALSADGTTLAICAPSEDSNATGVGGNQTDNSADYAGAVYVFRRTASVWAQEAYVKATNTAAGDDYGSSLALSADGDTLAVGAYNEDSSATGIGGNQANNATLAAGAAYVYRRTGTSWAPEAFVKATNTAAGDQFGGAVGLASDGNTLVVGATGQGGSGAAYTYTRAGATWSTSGFVKASNAGADDGFGMELAISGDGTRMAVASPIEDSAATGVGGNELDNTADRAGAVYLFERAGATWLQGAYIKASNTGAADLFGYHLVLTDDGHGLAIGAPGEASANTSQTDNTAAEAGAVYVFEAP